MYDGVVVEIEGAASDILQLLETHDTMSLVDLAAYTQLPSVEVEGIIAFLNKHNCTVDIASVGDGEDTVYSMEVYGITGAYVLCVGLYDNIQTVEIPKYYNTIRQVEVNAAKKFTKRSPSKVSKTSLKNKLANDYYIWPELYVPDSITGFIEPPWYNLLKQIIDDSHVAIPGPLGVGKSTAIKQLAHEQGKKFVSVSGEAGLTKRDLGGSQVITATKETKVAVAEYATAVVNGDWACIDEVDAAYADQLLQINSQLETPYTINLFGETFPVHSDFRLFITYNGKQYAGTKLLPQSFLDRFFIIEAGVPTMEFLEIMLIQNSKVTLSEKTICACLGIAAAFWEGTNMRFQLSPRRLYNAVRLADKDGNILEELYKSCILPYVWLDSEKILAEQFVVSGIKEHGLALLEDRKRSRIERESDIQSGTATYEETIF